MLEHPSSGSCLVESPVHWQIQAWILNHIQTPKHPTAECHEDKPRSPTCPKSQKSGRTGFKPFVKIDPAMHLKSRVQILSDQFNSSLGLPFQKLLPASTIEQTLKEENIKYRQRLFSPIVTLWAFLSQVIDSDQTCHNAVSRVIAWLAGKGEKIPSEDPSAYCQARTRLPENNLDEIIRQSRTPIGGKSSKRTIMVWSSRQSF